MSNGVVFIAFTNIGKHQKLGKNFYIKEAVYSAKSIKKMHPDLDITIFSNTHPMESCFDKVKIIPTDSIRIKQNFLEQSPYDRTLYIDSDTKLVGPIADIFNILDKYDIAATHDIMRKDPKKAKVWDKYASVPDGFSELGGGVILYKKSELMVDFFERWRYNYREWCEVSGKQNDQPSFRVTLWECDFIKLYILPPEFNKRFKDYNNIQDRIIHKHGLFKE